MRTSLIGLILVLVAAAPAAYGQDETETVNLLVPTGTPTGLFEVQTSERSDVGWKRLVVPVEGSVEDTVSRLERDLGAPVLVETLYRLMGQNEPDFGQQWALRNTGQQGGTPGADIKVTQAWSIARGQGVKVAVVDSGINANHPDLVGQVETGRDFFDGDNDPSPGGNTEADGHGTFVAGIIAAGVNDVGIAGVAPDATILNVRACDWQGCWSADVAAAIRYAVDNGADVINLSFGREVPPGVGDPPVESAISYARQHDVLVVTAAGNMPPGSIPEGWRIIPAEFPHSNNVAVAATDRRDRMADFSYYGDTIDIAAPGVDIRSTTLNGGHGIGEGTSFSAPHVAGAAALLLSSEPWISHHELAARLRAWADKPSDVAGKVQSGRLNAGALLRNRFVDTVGHTFENDAKWAADERVTRGCNPPENTRYCPNDPVTRGQMAAFLARHLNLPSASKDHFSDDNGSTFESDINRLAESGITRGCNPPTNTRFCPDDFVTREQMAAFLVRAFDLTANTHQGFSDVPSSNTFARDIDRLATSGITRGCNPPANTNYCPKNLVNRGQMAAFLHRADDLE